MSKEIDRFIAILSNCGYREKGDADMCTVFEETRKEGKIEGRAEEIVTMGCEFGLSESDILERLQRKLSISFQEAQKYFQMFGRKVEGELYD